VKYPEVVFGLERNIADDADGTYKTEILELLGGFQRELRRAIDVGMPPDEYAVSEELSKGIDAAAQVINRLWSRLHQA